VKKDYKPGIVLFVPGVALLVATSQGWLLPHCDWNVVCSGQNFVIQNGLYALSFILLGVGTWKLLRG